MSRQKQVGRARKQLQAFTFEIAGCIVPLYEAARPSINPTVVISCSYNRKGTRGIQKLQLKRDIHQLNERNKYHIQKQYKILNDEEQKRVKA